MLLLSAHRCYKLYSAIITCKAAENCSSRHTTHSLFSFRSPLALRSIPANACANMRTCTRARPPSDPGLQVLGTLLSNTWLDTVCHTQRSILLSTLFISLHSTSFHHHHFFAPAQQSSQTTEFACNSFFTFCLY